MTQNNNRGSPGFLGDSLFGTGGTQNWGGRTSIGMRGTMARSSHVGIQNVIAGDQMARALSPNRDNPDRGSSRTSAKDPNSLLRDTNTQKNSPKAIEVERKFRILQQHLKVEFENADSNGNGLLSKQELKKFLVENSKAQKRNMNQNEIAELEVRFDHIVNTLFDVMDSDHDKNIELNEFCSHYFKLQRNLHEEIEEIGYRINDAVTRAK